MNVLFVMIGGFLGACFRYLLSAGIPTPGNFPVGTMTINLLGCLLLGWFLPFIASRKNVHPTVALLIGTGFIGSFTTFSTFSIEVIHLLEIGEVGLAILYSSISIIIGPLLALMGYQLGNSRKRGEAS